MRKNEDVDNFWVISIVIIFLIVLANLIFLKHTRNTAVCQELKSITSSEVNMYKGHREYPH